MELDCIVHCQRCCAVHWLHLNLYFLATSKQILFIIFIMHLSILKSSTKEIRKIFPWYHDWVYSILLLYGWAPNIVLHNMQMTKGILSTPHHQGWMKKGPNLLLANLTLTFGDCAAFIPHLLLSVNVKFSEDSASGFCSHSILHFNFAYNNMYCNFGANSVDNLTYDIMYNWILAFAQLCLLRLV